MPYAIHTFVPGLRAFCQSRAPASSAWLARRGDRPSSRTVRRSASASGK